VPIVAGRGNALYEKAPAFGHVGIHLPEYRPAVARPEATGR